MKYKVLNKYNSFVRHSLVVGDVDFSVRNSFSQFETSDINIAYKYRELIDIRYNQDAPFIVKEE